MNDEKTKRGERIPETIASSGIAVFPSLRIGVTSTDSHTIGVCWYQRRKEKEEP